MSESQERKWAATSLPASEVCFRYLNESGLIAVVGFGADGRIQEANDAFLELVGYSREELLAGDVDWAGLTPPEGLPRLHEALAELWRTGRMTPHKREYLRRDQGRFWGLFGGVRLEGTPGGAGFVLDIAERPPDEEALRESERRFRSVLDHASDLITVINADGVIRYQSPSVERVLGYRPTDLVHRSAFEFVHPEDTVRARASLQRALSDPPVKTPVEYRFRHRSGEWLVLQSVGQKMPVEADRELLVVNSRDVTGQKRIEAQLRQAQKMEAIGQLAGGVAHDFNNLLSVIIGHGELLARSLPANDAARESLTEIARAAERGAALTRQLLAFSRQQVLEPRVLDLNAAITDAEKMLRGLLGENLRLTAVLQPNLLPVRVDPGQLLQVIINLAVNARDAMPEGGIVTLETREVELGGAYVEAHQEVLPGRYVMLAVSDTGCGMTAEVQAHVFEPFFTTKPMGQGTGLGLAVVHGIVKQSGGHISVASQAGRGTTFHVYLPAAQEAIEPDAEVLAMPRLAPAKETILLAEDEDPVREITALLLEALGYQVLKAATGKEALRLTEISQEKIDLLMADVVMPGMGGRELAEILRARNPGLKVLFQSGYMDDALIRHGLLQPGVAFLQKPLMPDLLARKLRELLDG
ncbi:MAG: PAS domain S-box protein [Verrucomicrobia bacterium]|nr:PAS domain S-box protein [Verrucomicrobiota bacterium]